MSATSFKGVKIRGGLVLGVLVVGYLGAVVKLYVLQIHKGDRLKKQALMQYRSRKKIRTIRGTIYDRNHRELALSVDMNSVYMNPTQVQGGLKGIAKLLGVPMRELEKKASSKKRFVWVKRKISSDQTKSLKLQAVKGIYTVPEGKRFYPLGGLAGHLLGFAGLDHRGLEGVERAYEKYLSEGSGLRGHDVKLTIDEHIQFVAEEALSSACRKYRAKGGQVLVMDPISGGILALAIYPSFDPNAFRQSNAGVWRNRSLTDGFEPGSIMKVFLAAAALEENLFGPDQEIFCQQGAVKIENATIHDWKPFGWLKFREVIEQSSNVGAVKIGMKLGKERFYEYLTRFGFGEKTGIGLSGESAGILRDLSEWSADTAAYHAIGQGVSVTSMQFIRAFCAVANGGMLPEPRIVEEIRDPASGALAYFTRKPNMKRVLSDRTCRVLASILQQVVETGTGKKGDMDNYTVAGKTGTAQKFDNRSGKYFEDRYVASFVGFAPVSSPRLAVLVALDEPQGQYYGGEVAAPVFARIVRQALEYLRVAPDKKDIRLADSHKKRGDTPKPSARSKGRTSAPSMVRRSGKTGFAVMPDLRGMSMRQVMKELSGNGLKVKIKGSGFAVTQDPPVGKKIPSGRICTVRFRPPTL